MNYRNCLKILCSISVVCLCCTCMGCSKTKSTGSTSITLNEVAHSVFYAPQYAAIELGYFKEEGIDLTLATGFGADNVMTSLISDDAQIGLMGSESSIYVYAQGASDYAVNFAQLTQRAGNFLVSRTAEDDFSWENLRGKTILGGRAGGMPQMLLEYILEKNGLTKEDVNIIQNVDFGSTAAAFSSGIADYTVEFEHQLRHRHLQVHRRARQGRLVRRGRRGHGLCAPPVLRAGRHLADRRAGQGRSGRRRNGRVLHGKPQHRDGRRGRARAEYARAVGGHQQG